MHELDIVIRHFTLNYKWKGLVSHQCGCLSKVL